jgi:hypothetical protein
VRQTRGGKTREALQRLFRHRRSQQRPESRPCHPGARLGLLATRGRVLSSVRPELLAKGRERGSNEHEDGEAEGNFSYY